MMLVYFFLNEKICIDGTADNTIELINYFRKLGYCIRKLCSDEYICRTTIPKVEISETEDVLLDNISILKMFIKKNSMQINYDMVDAFKNMGSSKFLCIKCKGVCMEPVVNSGEYMIVKKYEKRNITCNSIILFCRDGRLYLHRVNAILVKNGDAFYITRGDNAILYDRLVSTEQIVGVVAQFC